MDSDQKELTCETNIKATSDMNLKYVQSEELEETWKTDKRERLKQREQRIWEQFVQERDIVDVLSKDDPYQFMESLPESYILELLEKGFQNIKNEEVEVDISSQDGSDGSDDQNDLAASDSNDDNVYFMYHEQDEEGPEEEYNNSIDSTPCTVREADKEPETVQLAVTPRPTSGKITSKSSESMLENSIYCAKIKELQENINKESVKMISFLETTTINIEPEDVAKLTKRCSEFGVRFHRVHLYQLQRQLRDIQRHADGARAGGGARHTLVRALCVRLVSLLQSVLQAVQAVGKLLSAGGWCDADGLFAVLRDSAAPQLYDAVNVAADKNMEAICDQLGAAFGAHAARVAEYLNHLTTTRSSARVAETSRPIKKRIIKTCAKSNTRACDQRLSMYSLNAPRRNVTARTSLSGMSKSRVTVEHDAKTNDTPKKTHSKPRVRRRTPVEPETLVETVELNSLSRVGTPRVSAKSESVPPLPPLNFSPRITKMKGSRTSVNSNGDKEDTVKKTTENINHDGCKVADDNNGSREPHGICDNTSRHDCGEVPKNVQLICVQSTSPPKSTPREEKINDITKSPKKLATSTPNNTDKYRMTLDVPEHVTDQLLRYRSKYMQYMLSSALYANSSLGKPLEMISSVSEKIVDDLLLNCVNEMELKEFTEELYKSEMN